MIPKTSFIIFFIYNSIITITKQRDFFFLLETKGGKFEP